MSQTMHTHKMVKIIFLIVTETNKNKVKFQETPRLILKRRNGASQKFLLTCKSRNNSNNISIS